MEKNSRYIYVAEDGSWGDARGLVILDTAQWSDPDREEFDYWPEEVRANYLVAFAKFRVSPVEYATRQWLDKEAQSPDSCEDCQMSEVLWLDSTTGEAECQGCGSIYFTDKEVTQ